MPMCCGFRTQWGDQNCDGTLSSSEDFLACTFLVTISIAFLLIPQSPSFLHVYYLLFMSGVVYKLLYIIPRIKCALAGKCFSFMSPSSERADSTCERKPGTRLEESDSCHRLDSSSVLYRDGFMLCFKKLKSCCFFI